MSICLYIEPNISEYLFFCKR